MALWINFCRAISRNARILCPTELPRRPSAIEAAKGYFRTHAVQQTASLFNHYVGADEKAGWEWLDERRRYALDAGH